MATASPSLEGGCTEWTVGRSSRILISNYGITRGDDITMVIPMAVSKSGGRQSVMGGRSTRVRMRPVAPIRLSRRKEASTGKGMGWGLAAGVRAARAGMSCAAGLAGAQRVVGEESLPLQGGRASSDLPLYPLR